MAFSAEPIFPGMLHDAARRLAQDNAASRGGTGADPMTELGWPAVLVAEEYGGVGGTLADLASIVEGLAPQTLHLPVVERCAIAPILLQQAVAGERSAAWLRLLAEGGAQIAPLTGAGSDLCETRITATRTAAGFELNGVAEGVDISLAASHFLVLAAIEKDAGAQRQLAIFIAGAQALPAPARRYTAMDGQQTADYELRALALRADACLATGAIATGAIRAAQDAALAATCVEMVATLGSLVEQTVAYLNTRVQFGVALSTFQALRHRLVDVYIRYESSRGMIAQLMREAAGQRPAQRRDLQLLKVSLGESARFAAESAIQLHGGMGMSEEVVAARLAERLLASEFRYGDRFFHAAALTAGQVRATA